MAKPPPKQTSPKISTIAAKTLNGTIKPTTTQVKAMAASLISQDQTRGQASKRPK